MPPETDKSARMKGETIMAEMTKSERTRQFIVEKAAPIFNQKGVAGTSISDIMEATQLAKGGIYGNFASKEEIAVAAFDHIVEIIRQKVKAVTSPETTVLGKLYAILEFYRDYPARPPMVGGCAMINFGAEADDTNPLMKKRVSETILSFQQSVERLVTKGIQNGEFKEECDARIFAIKMYVMIEGAILVSRIQGNNRQMSLIIDLLKQEVAGWRAGG
jgi:AcrR family transcriptional regulator